MKQATIIFLMLASIQISIACKCNYSSLRVEIVKASEIFQGKVVDKEKVENGYIYEFEIEKSWKMEVNWNGDLEKTKRIKTGFGGGDCGSKFELGKSYIVFSNNGNTNMCRRNEETDKTYDDLKLDYYFSEALKKSSFRNDQPKLNEFEAEYLNEQFAGEDLNFDFSNKSIAFTSNKSIIGKSTWYASNWNFDLPVIELVQLSEAEREEYGVDAILVTWSKMKVSKRQRKKLLKKLR